MKTDIDVKDGSGIPLDFMILISLFVSKLDFFFNFPLHVPVRVLGVGIGNCCFSIYAVVVFRGFSKIIIASSSMIFVEKAIDAWVSVGVGMNSSQ